MPVDGGGVLMLTPGQGLRMNNGNLIRGLSMDRQEKLVAFSAETAGGEDQIYTVELDREIRVYPKLETGKPFNIELDLQANELGAVGASPGLSQVGPFTLPRFSGQYDLDIQNNVLATVLLGFGQTTTVTINIPNDPALIGLRFYYQGVRLTGANSGAFTRWGYYQVF